MRIGITERGDPSRDWSWTETIKKTDGAIIITKRITKYVGENVIKLHNEGIPIILHAGCTGWGATYMEPGVPLYNVQLESIKHMIERGFPKENITLRIDPIIPTRDGLQRAKYVLDYAVTLGLIPGIRVRISVLDEYRHVKARFAKNNLPEVFPGRFTAGPAEISALTKMLRPYHDKYGVQFECCAENTLVDPIYVHTGCVGIRDLEIMGLQPDTDQTNRQNRNGCKCLAMKYELLTKKAQCGNQCKYCYWQVDFGKN